MKLFLCWTFALIKIICYLTTLYVPIILLTYMPSLLRKAIHMAKCFLLLLICRLFSFVTINWCLGFQIPSTSHILMCNSLSLSFIYRSSTSLHLLCIYSLLIIIIHIFRLFQRVFLFTIFVHSIFVCCFQNVVFEFTPYVFTIFLGWFFMR